MEPRGGGPSVAEGPQNEPREKGRATMFKDIENKLDAFLLKFNPEIFVGPPVDAFEGKLLEAGGMNNLAEG